MRCPPPPRHTDPLCPLGLLCGGDTADLLNLCAALRTPLSAIRQLEAAARRKSLRSAQRGRGESSGSKAKRRLSSMLSPVAGGDAVPGASSRKQVLPPVPKNLGGRKCSLVDPVVSPCATPPIASQSQCISQRVAHWTLAK